MIELHTYERKKKYRVVAAVISAIFFIALVFQIGLDGLGLGMQLYVAISGVLVVVWRSSGDTYLIMELRTCPPNSPGRTRPRRRGRHRGISEPEVVRRRPSGEV